MVDYEESFTEDPSPRYSASYNYDHLGANLVGLSRSIDVKEDGRIDVDLASTSRSGVPLSATPLPTNHPKKTCDIKLNIVIQVVGSRGDVQPFIALGNELQKHGHRIRLATHNVFEDFVRNSGLEFYPIGGDPADLMAYMVKNPGLIPSVKTLRTGEIQRKRAMIAEMLHGCWESCILPEAVEAKPFVADAIIANPPSFAHVHCAQALGVPVHMMFTMPWTATKSFPHPLANLKYCDTDANFANYISYAIVDLLTWQGRSIGDVINTWRRNELDLEPVPVLEGYDLIKTLHVPFSYCWSPALVPKPTDWPSHIAPDYTPPAELEAFLNAGPSPIYIGFGSIVIEDPEKMTSILLEAVKRTGMRAVISRGWSNLGGEELPNVIYLDDCPHEWLFQHVAAVVHHGGAGTTACGLLNGKPTTIVPFFGDQPFWGNMIAAAGAGPKPIHHKSLNAENLTEAILYCCNEEARTAALSISQQMKKESGVQAAVESFHAHLPAQGMNCDLIPNLPAAWLYKRGKLELKLSKVAVEVLLSSSKIQSKDLKLYESKPIFIHNRRWDPVTAISSASITAAAEVADATIGIVTQPYNEYKRAHNDHVQAGPSFLAERQQSQPSGLTISSGTSNSINSPDVNDSSNHRPENSSHGSGKLKSARAMAGASANSAGKLLVRSSKGVLVDIPLAATEGLRAVPRLYQRRGADLGEVKDLKSGVVVAGKNFGYGIYEGFTDIFIETYHGKKKDGAMGAAKGLGKGLVSFATKTSSGVVGLIAYPGQGAAKSIYASVKSSRRKCIVEAKLLEGKWLIEDSRSIPPEYQVVTAFSIIGNKA
ncbi:sterol glucosyltransferase protein [Rutstroemia sp. NJR-2017a BBW]|nr:sterol glucosyltransferase protein [Rutstroemia sp. NJR-2017a BBW]